MKIGVAQTNSTVGDFVGNCLRIRDAYRRLRADGAEIVVAPELAVCGYPPRDLLERDEFLDGCERAQHDLAVACADGGALLVGNATRTQIAVGRPVHNSAVLLADGCIQAVVPKTLLPTYDVFDEGRYFRPAEQGSIQPISWGGVSLGVTVCEDVWNDADFWPQRLYNFDPAQHLVDRGAQVLLNLSASPFHVGKPRLRRRMLGAFAERCGIPAVHCNLVGGNDELIMDGGSFVAWPSGAIQAVAPSFVEAAVLVDLAAPPSASEPPAPFLPGIDAAIEAITLGIRDYFRKCGFRDAVVGLSGGIDSALTAALAVRALRAEHVTGITMPSVYSSGGSVEDSRQLAAQLGIDFHVVPIRPIHDALRGQLEGLWTSAEFADSETGGVTDQNLQARARGVVLMAWSNRTGALVLSTGNKSELAVGYCTLYGDMAGGLSVLSDLPKTMVYRMAERLNEGGPCIPQAILDKPPSAELAPDQLDSDSLPPYPDLDRILEAYLEEGQTRSEILASTELPGAVVDRVLAMVDRAEYKRRQAAPGLRVTSKAFGLGRRVPVAAKIRHPTDVD